MTKIKNNFILFVILLLMILISIFFIWDFNTGNATKLDEVKLKENNQISNGLAIMLENDTNDGKYAESESNMWPSSTDYRFNKELSGCMDNDGNTVSDALTYNKSTNSVSIKTKSNISCYMYFDLKFYLSELCESGDTLGSCLTTNNEEIDSLGDTSYSEMYRYTGTNEIVDDNYICFGTDDKETCINNPETYMYRIIGVTSETNDTLGLDTNQLKIIKHTSLETREWNSTSKSYITWENSTIYTYFQNILNNTTYFPNGWINKIDSVYWNNGNSPVTEKANMIYDYENNDITINPSKLGLIYLSDYYYAFNDGGTLNCNLNPCINWLTPTANTIWTMTTHGYHQNWNGYVVWSIPPAGNVTLAWYNSEHAVNPSFYLNKNEIYISGNGTLTDPIIIGYCNNIETIDECLIQNPTTGLDVTTPYSGMYRYIGVNANNYIILKDNTTSVLYRIIGIVSENDDTLNLQKGQLKLIKVDPIELKGWNSNDTNDAKWETSSLYQYLNDLDDNNATQVLNNTNIIPKDWKDNIDLVKWNIGDVQTYTDGNTIYELENDTKTNNTSKIGLIYLSDYYYAYTAGGTNNCSSSSCFNWITDTSDTPWTMTRYGYHDSYNSYFAWFTLADGTVQRWYLSTNRSVKPVFYLSSSLIYKNGNGTIDNPFILSY